MSYLRKPTPTSAVALPGTDDALRELQRLDREIHKLQRQRYKHREEEIVAKRCPTKIGDTVEATGYAFTGQKMQVTQIFCTEEFGGPKMYRYAWKMRGKVLNKDGAVGLRDAERIEYVATDVLPKDDDGEIDL